jgi:Zn ribbon nucleic-acid-binding protein
VVTEEVVVRKHHKWTTNDLSILAKPITSREAASQIGVSRDAINAARAYYGRPSQIKSGSSRQKWWAEDVVQILELMSCGWSTANIAKVKGTSRAVVKYIVATAKKRGMAAYPKRPKEGDFL